MGAIELQARQDISAAAPLREALSSVLASDADTLMIDGSAVEVATTPALQVLLSALRSAEKHNKKAQLTACSETMMRSIAALGLADSFEPFKE